MGELSRTGSAIQGWCLVEVLSVVLADKKANSLEIRKAISNLIVRTNNMSDHNFDVKNLQHKNTIF